MSKKVCCKVSSCENFQRQSCIATSFLYVTVHRCITGDVLIYRKFALKVTHPVENTPSKNADFDRFRPLVPQPWELARNVQLSLIGSRQRAFRRAIDEPCALSPPMGGSKREFLHLALPVISSLQVIEDISNLICGLNIASTSLWMTKRPYELRCHRQLELVVVFNCMAPIIS